MTEKLFDEDNLIQLAKDNHQKYISADPFPHIYFDNFFNPELVNQAVEDFPTPESFDFYKYDNALEKKLAFDQIGKLPESIGHILKEMNSIHFLTFLETLTGIEGIIPDPYYRGGGIHQIPKGGKLDVHIDFNIHPKLNLDRRLNVLLYLNKDWKEEYGGHFEIWRGHQENGKHILDEKCTSILPVFNRLAMFSTSEKSYHGHPDPLTCPEGWTRKSIATYYYTNGRPEEELSASHSTTFIRRPEDPQDEELEALRDKRNQGRLKSNVVTKHTA